MLLFPSLPRPKTYLRYKMAELNLGKGLTAGKVASNVQKKLTRAQEKVRAALVHVSVREMTVRFRPVRAAEQQCRILRSGAVSHHGTIIIRAWMLCGCLVKMHLLLLDIFPQQTRLHCNVIQGMSTDIRAHD